MFIPFLCCQWHTAAHKPLGAESKLGGKKDQKLSRHLVPSQCTFQYSSWENAGSCLWSGPLDLRGPHLELED